MVDALKQTPGVGGTLLIASISAALAFGAAERINSARQDWLQQQLTEVRAKV